MSASQRVRETIESIEPETVFGYDRFTLTGATEMALAKSLSRLAKEGIIRRFGKGRYYKPKQSRFGVLRPSESAVIDALTLRNQQRIGYLTGPVVYNQLGLTTQVANTLVIGAPNPRPARELTGYQVRYVKRSLTDRPTDVPLLQLLDALQDCKRIPDASAEQVLSVLIPRISALTPTEQQRLVTLVQPYKPATRALLGAILAQYSPIIPVVTLKKSLNPLSRYRLGLPETLLANQADWSIV